MEDFDEGGNQEDDGLAEFTLRINTIATKASSTQTTVTEKLKSLRIILLDDASGRIEINEKVELPLAEYNAGDFIYTYKTKVPEGKKKVFLVGNEESVGAVELANTMITPPQGMPQTSLTAMLDFFKTTGSEGSNNIQAADFERILNNVYFNNPQLNPTDGSSVYLPYSAYYELDVAYHSKVNSTMYLVPVAAKFDIVITNFRQKDAQIDDVIINGFNAHNYLNAQLAEGEKYRTLNGIDTWWIDWLKVCSEESQKAADNELFNQGWGWITNYYLPIPEEPTTVKHLNSAKELWTIPKLTNMLSPNRLYLGPYYVPESKNIITIEEDQMTQEVEGYTISFLLRDVGAEEIVSIPDNYIDTAKALFRGTHVVVYVELYESMVEIYAEIAQWTDWAAKGYVQEADDD